MWEKEAVGLGRGVVERDKSLKNHHSITILHSVLGVATLPSSNSEMKQSSTRLFFFFGRSKVRETNFGSGARQDEKMIKNKSETGKAPDGIHVVDIVRVPPRSLLLCGLPPQKFRRGGAERWARGTRREKTRLDSIRLPWPKRLLLLLLLLPLLLLLWLLLLYSRPS